MEAVWLLLVSFRDRQRGDVVILGTDQFGQKLTAAIGQDDLALERALLVLQFDGDHPSPKPSIKSVPVAVVEPLPFMVPPPPHSSL